MRLKLQCDGGSRGNPGLAGAGATIVDAADGLRPDAEELAAQWEYIEKATNNFAEYRGLINGLALAKKYAAQLGQAPEAVTVDVFMDSKLIVEQMSGRWKIKNADLKPLAAQVKQLEAEFDAVSYTWVPRAQNKRADELANRAMDDKESGEWLADATPTEATPADATPTEASSETPTAKPASTDADPASPAAAENLSSGDSPDASTTVVDREQGASDNNDPTLATHATVATHASPSWHGGTKPTRFVLVRHGESVMNADQKFTGLSDPELTELGRWQAEQIGRYIGQRGGVHAVISSPLGRARDTAQAIATPLGLDVTTDQGLIEMDFGQWEGRTFSEVRAHNPSEYQRIFHDASSCPPDGECPNDVYARVEETIRRMAREHEGRTVVLVSHVTPIKSVLRLALGVGASIYRTMHLGLASLSMVEFYPDGSGLVWRVNDTHYLER